MPTETERLVVLAEALRAAKRGSREALLQQACQELGISRATLFRKLKAHTVTAPRKRRADAGQYALPRDEARLLSAMLLEGYRKNDKKQLPLEDAVQTLRDNGLIRAEVLDKATGEVRALSVSAIARALYGYGLHPEQLRTPAPHIHLKSAHPNHLWQVDASVCTLYYLPDGKHLLKTDKTVHYKNKPENVRAIEKLRIIRYVLTDHCSGVIRWRYYPHAETGAHTVRFLAWGMAPKNSRYDPFHGAPFHLMVDPGATASGLVARFCKLLGINLIVNKPGAPRAKGQVESGQNIVETHFEWRLGYVEDRIESIAHINDLADRFQIWFNNQALHTRTNQCRFSVWSTIRPEHLRITPPKQDLLRVASEKPQQRIVAGDLSISLDGKTYDARKLPNVMVKSGVFVAKLPLTGEVVAILTGEDGREQFVPLPEIEKNEYGFRTDAVEIGSYRSDADTVLDEARKRALLLASDATTQEEAEKKRRKPGFIPFGGKIDPFRTVDQNPPLSVVPRLGIAQPLAARTSADSITATAFLVRLWRQHSVSLTQDQQDWLRGRFPNGLTEEQAEALLREFAGGPRAISARGG